MLKKNAATRMAHLYPGRSSTENMPGDADVRNAGRKNEHI